MPNLQAPQSQYVSIEVDGQFEIVNVPIDVEDAEDYNLSDFSESDDDINEDFGMEDDGINREIGGKQLEGKQQGDVYKEKEWAIRTIIYFLELKSNQHIL